MAVGSYASSSSEFTVTTGDTYRIYAAALGTDDVKLAITDHDHLFAARHLAARELLQ